MIYFTNTHPRFGYTTVNASRPAYSGSAIDCIFSNPESSEDVWMSVNTNNTFDASFTFDTTVTSGAVSFQASSSSGTPDFRLVADADNLAVRYMDLSSVLTADIAGVSRPGSTDAGAYQSVSNRILSATIGNADTSADYTSWSLFFNASPPTHPPITPPQSSQAARLLAAMTRSTCPTTTYSTTGATSYRALASFSLNLKARRSR